MELEICSFIDIDKDKMLGENSSNICMEKKTIAIHLYNHTIFHVKQSINLKK